jgi:hypothetical protein
VRKLAMRKFLGQLTQLSGDRHTCAGGVFICVKKYITCANLCADEAYEIAEVKGRE